MSTNTKTKINWIAIGKVGHRYYLGSPGCGIAVADDSAQAGKPWTADDGLLLLDRKRPVSITGKGVVVIPLLRENGEPTETIGSHLEMRWLRDKVGMKVKEVA